MIISSFSIRPSNMQTCAMLYFVLGNFQRIFVQLLFDTRLNYVLVKNYVDEVFLKWDSQFLLIIYAILYVYRKNKSFKA